MKKSLLLIASSSFALCFLLAPNTSKASFGFYRSVTATSSATAIPAAQSNFPAVVDVTLASLKTTGNGGNVQNANGYDIGFYSSTDCATGKINYQRENYVGTTGEFEAWVPITTLNTSTVVYMCYGDASVSTDPSSSTAPWDANYVSVYHLTNGGAATTTDSTANKNDGVNTSVQSSTAGQIDGATSFDGTNGYIAPLGKTNIPSGAASTMMEGWFNASVATGGYRVGVSVGDVTTASTGYFVLNHNGDAILGLQSHFDTDTGVFASAGWHHIAITYDGTTQNTYVDGSQFASNAQTYNVQLNNIHSIVGIGVDANPGFSDPLWQGTIDETRISNVARSANWVKTDYWNSFATGTAGFWNVGSETAVGGGGSSTTQLAMQFIWTGDE